MKQADYTVYTDGGCDVNPGGKGGYGIVLCDNRTNTRKEYLGAYYPTTNNRMEMIAVIKALEHIPEDVTITLYSDSRYVVDTLTKGWKKNKNKDLWARLNKASQNKRITYRWVKAHNGIPDNERCDELATQAIQSVTPEKDNGFNKSALNTSADTRKQSGNKEKTDIPKNREKKAHGAMDVKISVPEHMEDECRILASVEKIMSILKITETCAECMLDFWKKEKPSFKDYAALKTGGTDQFSGYKKAEIIEKCGQEVWNLACLYFNTDSETCSALRWHMRGLSLSDSIRKELVSREIAANKGN